MMSHIVESCPRTKLNGSLSQLHSADEDAVSWLTNYGAWHAYKKKKTGVFTVLPPLCQNSKHTRLRTIISLPLTMARWSGAICVESWRREFTLTQTDSRNRTASRSPFWTAMCRKLRPLTSNCDTYTHAMVGNSPTIMCTSLLYIVGHSFFHSYLPVHFSSAILYIFCS